MTVLRPNTFDADASGLAPYFEAFPQVDGVSLDGCYLTGKSKPQAWAHAHSYAWSPNRIVCSQTPERGTSLFWDAGANVPTLVGAHEAAHIASPPTSRDAHHHNAQWQAVFKQILERYSYNLQALGRLGATTNRKFVVTQMAQFLEEDEEELTPDAPSMSKEEACNLLQLAHISSINEYTQKGLLTAVKVPGVRARRVTFESVEQFRLERIAQGLQAEIS